MIINNGDRKRIIQYVCILYHCSNKIIIVSFYIIINDDGLVGEREHCYYRLRS